MAACTIFDDSAIWDKLDDHENRIVTLETLCSRMNTNINSLQSIITALQESDFITGVTPITENGVEIGYTITFSKSKPITIYHGTDGKDGEEKNEERGEDGKVTVLRTITKIRKLYDVSAVSLPANDATEISARMMGDGELARITEERRAVEERQRKIQVIKTLLEV